MAPNLHSSDTSLAAVHDVALLDLDGVVYVGPDAVPGAPEVLAQARGAGMRLAFVTNNAARPPSVVADHLSELGIAADAGEVITSSQAAARYLADRLPSGARVLVIGTVGLLEALGERGLTPVESAAAGSAADGVAAVVQGYSPTLSWSMLAEGAVAINSGVPWVATNVDPTVPSPRGPLPGNGSTVAALVHATGREPVVTGKPDPTMHRETLIRTGAKRPIVVGDRLDTDIEGANAVGCMSLLVFSGVTTPAELLAARPEHRPSYLASDLRGLLTPHRAPQPVDGGWRCGRWLARADGEALVLSRAEGMGGAASDGAAVPPARFGEEELDALRALCPAAWSGQDESGPGGSGRREPPPVRVDEGDAESARAREVLDRLGLA